MAQIEQYSQLFSNNEHFLLRAVLLYKLLEVFKFAFSVRGNIGLNDKDVVL